MLAVFAQGFQRFLASFKGFLINGRDLTAGARFHHCYFNVSDPDSVPGIFLERFTVFDDDIRAKTVHRDGGF